MRKLQPNTRAVRLLESLGWTADLCQRSVGKVNKDLFGFADVLAVRSGRTLAVQATDASHVASRVDNLFDCSAVVDCLRAGWWIEVWGFRKTPARDGSLVVARTLQLNDDTLSVFEHSLVVSKLIPQREISELKIRDLNEDKST